jgi:hypothetical protein
MGGRDPHSVFVKQSEEKRTLGKIAVTRYILLIYTVKKEVQQSLKI